MNRVGQLLAIPLICALRFYRWFLSPVKSALFGPSGSCRFTPTCSCYAIEAVQRHGCVRGAFLALHRLFRCHPWGSAGYDPVPSASLNVNATLHSLENSSEGEIKIKSGIRIKSKLAR